MDSPIDSNAEAVNEYLVYANSKNMSKSKTEEITAATVISKKRLVVIKGTDGHKQVACWNWDERSLVEKIKAIFGFGRCSASLKDVAKTLVANKIENDKLATILETYNTDRWLPTKKINPQTVAELKQNSYKILTTWEISEQSVDKLLSLLQANSGNHQALAYLANLAATASSDDNKATFATVTDHLRQAIKKNPNDAFLHALLGRISGYRKEFDNAKKHLEKAIKIEPDNAFARICLADVLQQQGDLNEAKTQLEKVIEIAPKHLFARALLGNVLKQLKEFDEAEKCLRTVIESDPDYDYALTVLGEVLYKQNKLYEAEGYLRTAIKINPDYDYALATLGEVLYKKNRLLEAEWYLKRAIEINPDYDYAQNLHENVLSDIYAGR